MTPFAPARVPARCRAVLAVLMALAACNNILAIEDAHVDPTLSVRGAQGGAIGELGSKGGGSEGGTREASGESGNAGTPSWAGASSGGAEGG